MQGRIPRGIKRKAFAGAGDFQGTISGLRGRPHSKHRGRGFFIRHGDDSGGRRGCPARGQNKTEPVTRMVAEDYRDWRPGKTLVVRWSRIGFIPYSLIKLKVSA